MCGLRLSGLSELSGLSGLADCGTGSMNRIDEPDRSREEWLSGRRAVPGATGPTGAPPVLR
ncbi:hypothetical protein GCM10018790_67740 [Kitasatospora xanthocidica]|nr:hypothetical protein GCM10018790_67740 [Kitasatospora xanthocidica]